MTMLHVDETLRFGLVSYRSIISGKSPLLVLNWMNVFTLKNGAIRKSGAEALTPILTSKRQALKVIRAGCDVRAMYNYRKDRCFDRI